VKRYAKYYLEKLPRTVKKPMGMRKAGFYWKKWVNLVFARIVFTMPTLIFNKLE
jgi:hypothetical protein